MDRLLAWYRVSSSVGAVVALIVANAIPLIGVLLFGWSVWNILVVYWLENGIVGAFNVLKMARAEGPAPAGSTPTEARSVGPASKVALIPFFVMHYGLFWVVHGIFVLTLPLFTGMFEQASDPFGPATGAPIVDPFDPAVRSGIDAGTVGLAVVALAISHGVSFAWNYLRGGEYRRVTAGQLMGAPYGRLVALHLTIILGAMAIIGTGAPVAAVAILVGVKTVIDLGLHLKEHRAGSGPILAGSA